MTEMSAITLWQPWASLCVLRKPCIRCSLGECNPMLPLHERRPFKTIETRSWPAPKALIGQRIAIHAAKKRVEWPYRFAPNVLTFGNADDVWLDVAGRREPLPLGAVIGTAVLTDCAPMGGPYSFRTGHVEGDEGDYPGQPVLVIHDQTFDGSWRLVLSNADTTVTDVSDQLPFGDFRPGRWAWLLADAIALDEPIPWRGGQRIWKLPASTIPAPRRPCPNDTDGDGNCGQRGCPYCGEWPRWG